MTYVTAGLHGEYGKFQELLQKIHFRDSDLLYVLGDVVDYGSESMELIADLSVRANVYPIAGEHDYRAARMLAGFDRMLKNGAAPDPGYISEMTAWVADGGQPTLDGFRALDEDAREGVLDYLGEMVLFEETEIGGKNYLMTYSGIAGYDPDTELDEYPPEAFFHGALPQDRPLIADCTVIVSSPVSENGKIARGKGSILLNCDVSGGGKLACLCLETGAETYV